MTDIFWIDDGETELSVDMLEAKGIARSIGLPFFYVKNEWILMPMLSIEHLLAIKDIQITSEQLIEMNILLSLGFNQPQLIEYFS